MRSKLLILSLFFWIGTFAQSVPNSAVLSLKNDVYPVVHAHASGTTANLNSLRANAVDAYFDPSYKGSKDRLSNFRNYRVNCAGITVAVDPSPYPNTHNIDLGTAIGTVTLTFNPLSVPDLVLIYWNGTLVLNSGYIGSADYACGGTYRWTEFNKYLGGLNTIPITPKSDPVYGGTYPNSNHTACADKYPTVTVTTQYINSFSKTTSSNMVIIYVYPSKSSSGYNFTLSCPQ